MADRKDKITKGTSHVRGLITGLSEKNYKKKNDWFKELGFGIKTSDDNLVWVQISEYIGKGAKKTAKIGKNTDNGFEMKDIPYDERNMAHDDDWFLLGVQCKAEDETLRLVDEDAIKYILKNFKNGDSVFLNLNNGYYEGSKSTVPTYGVTAIYKATGKIDFEADDFKEVADFKQKFVYKEMVDMDDQYFVNGYVFDYKDNSVSVTFTVNKNELGKEIAGYIEESVDSGDLLTVEGTIHNRAIYRKADDEEKTTGVLVGKAKETFKSKEDKNTDFIKEGERKELEITAISEQPVKGAFANMDKQEEEDKNSETPEGLEWLFDDNE